MHNALIVRSIAEVFTLTRTHTATFMDWNLYVSIMVNNLYIIYKICTTSLNTNCGIIHLVQAHMGIIYSILLHDEAIHQRREVCNIKSNAHFGVH